MTYFGKALIIKELPKEIYIVKYSGKTYKTYSNELSISRDLVLNILGEKLLKAYNSLWKGFGNVTWPEVSVKQG